MQLPHIALVLRQGLDRETLERHFGVAEGLIPMWIADMDFPAAPAIRAALQAEVDLGYMGYFGNADPHDRAVANWYRDRHGWNVDPGCVRYTHGVVSGFADVLATFTTLTKCMTATPAGNTFVCTEL